jgi:hypothetical protein
MSATQERKPLTPEAKVKLRVYQRLWRKGHRVKLSAYQRLWRAKNRESASQSTNKYAGKNRARINARKSAWRRANPEKRAAQAKVLRAVKNGTLVKPDRCTKCRRATRLEGHHEDYTQPLVVIWLCSSCHRRHHEEGLAHEQR